MRPAQRLLALTALAAVAVGGAWLAARSSGPAGPGPSVALAAEPAVAPGAEAPSAPLSAPDEIGGEAPEPIREVVPDSGPERTEPARLSVPADAIWIEGRVIFPAETPPDEHVRVVARGKAFPGTDRRRTHEVELAADGSFRAAFAPKTRKGWVRLEAHYLYLEQNVRVNARELPNEVLLEPEVGARVLLTVTPPPGADPGELDEVIVQGYVWDLGGDLIAVPQVVDEHEDGVFELASLPPGHSLRASVTSPTCCDRHLEVGGLRAGETHEVELALVRGARLTGRVERADGAPLKGVGINARTEDVDYNEGWTGFVSATSKDDGSFDLRGVAPGTVTLQASHSDHLDASLELGTLADGNLRQDLVLRLGEGGVLAGLVQWPDGRPVAGARIEVHQEREQDGFVFRLGATASAKSGEDGGFRITGLEDGPCTVRARARPERGPEDGLEDGQGLLERRRSGFGRRRAPYWRVTVEDVLPSGPDLVLVLQGGGAVSGRVVDDAGAAVEKFKVHVRTPGLGRDFGFGDPTSTSVADSFKSEDGSFVLEGVPEGEWVARATARGHGPSGTMPVRVPQAGELVLVVPREATVAGVVLDPDGRPVHGARVQAETEEDGWVDSILRDADRTGRDGTFELSLAPGEFEVHAQDDGYAESVRTTLEVAPAERRAGLVLALRRAGRISGVLDPSLGELAGREVDLNHLDGPGWDETRTDDRGRFEFGGLAPGTFRLGLQESRQTVDGEGVTSYYSTTLTSLTLELGEAEERHVVLGAAPAHAVRASGRVTAGGTPVTGISVTRDPRDRDNERTTTTDEDGRYELDVDGTGFFTVGVGRGWGQSTSLEVEVPEGARTFELDVELPTARVSGRLVGPDGAPVGDAYVTLVSRDEGLRSVQSSEDGTFVLEHVQPGTYELLANDQPMAFFGRTARFGHGRIPDLEVPETGVGGLELHLPRPATIEGTVLRVDGSIAPHSAVYVTDAQGRSIGRWSRDWTDETGRYAFRRLGPGTYLVHAEIGGSSEEHEVRLAEGVTYTLDLILDR